jgi:hypothetical protein
MPSIRSGSRGKYQAVSAADYQVSDSSSDDEANRPDATPQAGSPAELGAIIEAQPPEVDAHGYSATGTPRREGLRSGWASFTSKTDGRTFYVNTHTVRAVPGRLSALSIFPIKIGFVWGFCMGAQGA